MTDVLHTIRLKLSQEPWRQTLAATLGSVLGWALVEPFFHEGGCLGRWGTANAFFLPVVAGMVCAALLLAESLPRQRFSAAAGLACAGFGAAFALGFLLQMPLHMLYAWLRPATYHPVESAVDGGGWPALTARCVAWGGLGVVSGLASAIVTGRWRLYSAAAMGGLFGGLVSGFAFDPFQLWLHSTAGGPAWASRFAGFAVMGGMAGFVTGVWADMLRQSRLIVLSGPLAGTQVGLDTGPCWIGTSHECTLTLPEDGAVQPVHTVIEKVGFGYEIRAADSRSLTTVNGHRVMGQRLADGDRVLIGETKLAFFSG